MESLKPVDMSRSERIKRLTQMLWKYGKVSTQQVIDETGLSAATVRRDMNYLAEINSSVNRYHGGLVFDSSDSDLEYLFEVKKQMNTEAKDKIARKALEFIDDGDHLLLDSGTSCLTLANMLDKQGLRVTTTDIKVAEQLGRNGAIESYIVGGRIRAGYFTVGEQMAVTLLDMIPIEKAFVSCDALNIETGITNHSLFEMDIKRKIFEKAKQVYVLCDASKFDQKGLYTIASWDQVNSVITCNLPPELAQKYKAAGISVIEV